MGFTREQNSLAVSTMDYVKYLNREYSESGTRGYSKQKNLKHIAEIPAFLFLVDPDLIMFQKSQCEGDRKGCRKHMTRFLENNPKFRIKCTR